MVLDGRVKNGTLYFLSAKVILMDCLVVGVEIDLCFVHIFPCENFLEYSYHISQHFALPSFFTHIHQENEHLFRRNLAVEPASNTAYPAGPSTKKLGEVRST